jgi:hypothetical protein
MRRALARRGLFSLSTHSTLNGPHWTMDFPQAVISTLNIQSHLRQRPETRDQLPATLLRLPGFLVSCLAFSPWFNSPPFDETPR